MKRDTAESKERILEAAEAVFAETGFDGARVDEIAKRAGVNKALIYYYFDSKDAILDALFEELIKKGRQVQNRTLADFPDVRQDDIFRQVFDGFVDFALQNRRLIKVALAESMKADPKHAILLKMGEQIIDTEIENIKQAYESRGGVFPYERRDLLVTEFFTGVLPIFNFAAFYDEWMAYYSMSEAELKAYFFDAFKSTHLASHLSRYK